MDRANTGGTSRLSLHLAYGMMWFNEKNRVLKAIERCQSELKAGKGSKLEYILLHNIDKIKIKLTFNNYQRNSVIEVESLLTRIGEKMKVIHFRDILPKDKVYEDECQKSFDIMSALEKFVADKTRNQHITILFDNAHEYQLKIKEYCEFYRRMLKFATIPNVTLAVTYIYDDIYCNTCYLSEILEIRKISDKQNDTYKIQLTFDPEYQKDDTYYYIDGSYFGNQNKNNNENNNKLQIVNKARCTNYIENLNETNKHYCRCRSQSKGLFDFNWFGEEYTKERYESLTRARAINDGFSLYHIYINRDENNPDEINNIPPEKIIPVCEECYKYNNIGSTYFKKSLAIPSLCFISTPHAYVVN